MPDPARGGPDIQSAQAEAYNGPKARIAVADFEDKMSSRGQYRAEYGRGLSDMLTTALFQTNRYIVLEREKLGAVVGELKHGTSDLFRREATAPLGELEGADLLINAAITGFDHVTPLSSEVDTVRSSGAWLPRAAPDAYEARLA